MDLMGDCSSHSIENSLRSLKGWQASTQHFLIWILHPPRFSGNNAAIHFLLKKSDGIMWQVKNLREKNSASRRDWNLQVCIWIKTHRMIWFSCSTNFIPFFQLPTEKNLLLGALQFLHSKENPPQKNLTHVFHQVWNISPKSMVKTSIVDFFWLELSIGHDPL